MEEYDRGYVKAFQDIVAVLNNHSVFDGPKTIIDMGNDLTRRMFEKYSD